MVAFVAAGMVPLLPLFFTMGMAANDSFPFAATLTGITFFGIGWLRGSIVDDQPLYAGFETVFIGGTAAVLAYAVGLFLQGLV